MARIYREMPLNSIWEGAGNIMALDLLRALRSGPVAEALMHETAAARAAHAGVQRLARSVHHAIEVTTDEAQARRLAKDVALLLQASLLRQLSSDEVFEAFCASRINQAADIFGLLPSGLDLTAVIARAMPQEH